VFAFMNFQIIFFLVYSTAFKFSVLSYVFILRRSLSVIANTRIVMHQMLHAVYIIEDTEQKDTLMPDIFSYTDYRLFLKDFCEDIRKEKPFFSYRYITQKAGLKSVGFISWVVSGKRNMSASLTHKVSSILKIGKRESDYFELLVNHNQAKTTGERQHYLDRLVAFRSTRTTIVDRDRDQYYSRWYYSVIRELVSLTDIKNESQISSLLRPPITRSEAREGLDLLERLGMIRLKNDKTYERIDTALISGSNVDPAIIHGFQITTMQLAQSALHRFPKSDRNISTVTLSCSANDLARIHDRMAQMRAEIIEIACASGNADQVFQLNTQFYPLTKKITGDNL
jgi:uncharacterized protein (TIGR02147 family)